MTPFSPWTPAMLDRLVELFEDGHTYPDIAGQLNREFGTHFTKNACIGRGRRLGLAVRTAPKLPSRPPPWRPFARVLTNRKPPRPGEIAIEQLTNETCRWPHGENPPFSYCGKKVAVGSYCRTHADMSYAGNTRRAG